MARGKFLVFNEPVSPEREGDYNDWYDNEHLPQILENVPAITSAKRYRVVPGQNVNVQGAPRYLAVYEIEADDVMDAFAQLGQATQEGKVVMRDVIRSEPGSTYLIYEEL